VVPDYEKNEGLSKSGLRAKIEEHFHKVSKTLPLYKRVKTLQVVGRRASSNRHPQSQTTPVVTSCRGYEPRPQPWKGERADDSGWLADIVATIAEKPRSSIRTDTRFDELGFDSLMYTELATAIESGEASLLCRGSEESRRPRRVGGSPEAKASGAGRKDPLRAPIRRRRTKKTIAIPPIIIRRGEGDSPRPNGGSTPRSPARVQREGQCPPAYHFIVVCQPCFHLDMGLVKMALGDQGKNLVALAAARLLLRQ